MSITVRQLAELVQGQLQGDGDLVIHAARPLNLARAGDITFVDNQRNAKHLHASPASAAVTLAGTPLNGKPLIQVADPLLAFAFIVRHLHGRPDLGPSGVDPKASVHSSAMIGADASILAFANVGAGSVLGARCRLHSGVNIGRDCRLGDDVVLHPNVVLYDGTIVGDRVVIHANSVIGADGFGYRFQNGRHAKVPQLGWVEIEADVEIGACTAIDRGTFEATVIGLGTKIDNLVQVGHNCKIGKHNILCGQVGIAGSCTTGDHVVLAGQVGIADHLTIGAGAVVGAQAGVSKDVPAGQRYFGTPAMILRDHQRMLLSIHKLPDIRQDLKRIKQQLGLTDDQSAA